MKVELFGCLTTFGEADHGAVFRFARRDGEYLGMKIRMEGYDGSLVFNPAAQRLPVVMLRRDDSEERIFELTGAIFRPSGQMILSDLASIEHGDLALIENRACLYVAVPGPMENGFVDVATGEVITPRRAAAVANRWSIVQIVDQKPVALFEFGRQPVAKAAE